MQAKEDKKLVPKFHPPPALRATSSKRRPRKIDKAYLKMDGMEGELLLTDSFADYRNKIITEENPTTTFFVEQSLIDFSKILYIGAMDATDRRYKKYLIPLHKRIYNCILKIINKINSFV